MGIDLEVESQTPALGRTAHQLPPCKPREHTQEGRAHPTQSCQEQNTLQSPNSLHQEKVLDPEPSFRLIQLEPSMNEGPALLHPL